MTVIIKPINKREIIEETHYREFDNVMSIDDKFYPIIKLKGEMDNTYAMMRVPDNCYLLVINE